MPAGAHERLDAGDGLVNLFPPAVHFRYQAGNRPAMARDDDDLAALDVIKQLRMPSMKSSSRSGASRVSRQRRRDVAGLGGTTLNGSTSMGARWARPIPPRVLPVSRRSSRSPRDGFGAVHWRSAHWSRERLAETPASPRAPASRARRAALHARSSDTAAAPRTPPSVVPQ